MVLSHRRILEHRLDRGADVGQRGPRAFGERLEQRVAAAVDLNRTGNVLQRKHEAIDVAFPVEDRRHVCTHELSPAPRGDEMSGWVAAALSQLVPDRVQCVNDQALIHDREDGTAQADECAADAALFVGRLVEQLLGASVVEQDTPFAVAHQNALRQVRHQRGEAILFRFEAGICVADPGFHVILQTVVGVGKAVDGCGEPLHLLAPRHARAVRRVDGLHDVDIFHELDRRH